ncbi:MAG: ornithine decarboxylase [Lentimonas sp.]|jgi:ornithine decarboxylase
MEPSQYRGAIDIVKEVVKNAGVQLDILDIGGGFPSSYPSLTPPPLKNYIEEINDSLKTLDFKHPCQIWCEPGRALVAESGSLVVRVEARKNQMLYINDGTYGALFDAGSLGFIYPAKIIRLGNKPVSGNLIDFGFYGPTCDSIDVMRGPFYLPEDICEGDYIEIGGLGAYSKSIRTKFNGFDDFLEIETNDSPLISMYDENRESLLDQQSSKF